MHELLGAHKTPGPVALVERTPAFRNHRGLCLSSRVTPLSNVWWRSRIYRIKGAARWRDRGKVLAQLFKSLQGINRHTVSFSLKNLVSSLGCTPQSLEKLSQKHPAPRLVTGMQWPLSKSCGEATLSTVPGTGLWQWKCPVTVKTPSQWS